MSTAMKALVAVVVLAGVGVAAYLIMNNSGSFEKEQETNITTMEGEVACLPLKDGTTPDKKDCKLGLRNERGLFLELQNASAVAEGKRVEVKGPVSPAPENSKYNTVGVMVVQSQTAK